MLLGNESSSMRRNVHRVLKNGRCDLTFQGLVWQVREFVTKPPAMESHWRSGLVPSSVYSCRLTSNPHFQSSHTSNSNKGVTGTEVKQEILRAPPLPPHPTTSLTWPGVHIAITRLLLCYGSLVLICLGLEGHSILRGYRMTPINRLSVWYCYFCLSGAECHLV